MIVENSVKEHARFKLEAGFTLVEMAIVLVILGFVFTTVALGFSFYTKDRYVKRTITALEEGQTALFTYQISQGRYPCPADPTLAPNDVNYGRAACNSANVVNTVGRDADGDGVGDIVLIGAMPFNELLDPDGDPTTADEAYPDYRAVYGLDGWGSKITYAVALNLTNHPSLIVPPATALPEINYDLGAINIVDENNNLLLEREGIAHFALVSHGPNQRGAYLENGSKSICSNVVVIPGAPPAPITLPLDESENCDFESVIQSDAEFMKGVFNETSDDYNDDFVKFFIASSGDLWAYTGQIDVLTPLPDGTNLKTEIKQIENQNTGFVGIGTDTPTSELHVNGDIQAVRVNAEKLCDGQNNTVTCLDPEVLGGELISMKCPAGEAVVKIGRTKSGSGTPNPVSVHCESVFNALSFTKCPDGEFLHGFSSKTGKICKKI